MEALRWFNGQGVVRLLDADPQQGVLLLEHLRPGTPLTRLEDDEQVTEIAIRTLCQLWRPVSQEHPFPTVAGWAGDLQKLRARFAGGCGPFPPRLVEQAEGLFKELLQTGSEPVLLHGDIHPQNILRSERQPWLAIDPKGVVGDRLYDAADFLCSLPQLPGDVQRKAFVERRLNQLVELLGFDRQAILGWATALAVLSGWWSFEDHGGGWEKALALAELFITLR
jgi:streptomycin 6-kinase